MDFCWSHFNWLFEKKSNPLLCRPSLGSVGSLHWSDHGLPGGTSDSGRDTGGPNHLKKKTNGGKIPSQKLTARTWNWMVGILVSFWDSLFSGAMLVFGGVSLAMWKPQNHQFFGSSMWVFGVRSLGIPRIHEKSKLDPTILIKLTLWLHTTSKSITGGSWLQMKTFYHGSHVAHPFWVNMGMPWKTNMEMGMSWKTNMFHLESQAFEKENHLNHPPPFLGSNPSFSKVYVLGCSPAQESCNFWGASPKVCRTPN